jgi:heat shock protein HslJ
VIQRFQVNPEQIAIGQCVLVDWNIEGEMDSVVLLRNNQEIYRGAVVKGSREDCPPVVGNTLYVLQASGPGGTATRNRTVVVSDQVAPTQPPPTQPPPPTSTPTVPPPPTAIPTTPPPVVNPPVIYSFVAQPSQVNVGQCVDVSWDVGGDPESVRILRNGTLAADNLPTSGGGQDCFSERGTVDYQLEASGQGQTVSAQASVQVILQASFQLVSLRNSAGETVPVLPGTAITLNINGNQISGSAGCNTYNTTYAQNGEELVVQPPQVTLQMCAEPAGIMEQESQYLTNLQMANRYRSSGPTLELIARTIDPASGTEVELVVLVYNMAR